VSVSIFLAIVSAQFGDLTQGFLNRRTVADRLIDIISRRDVEGLRLAFPVIHGDTGDSFPSYTPEHVMNWLSGCSLDRQQMSGTTYILDYACPARRATARGCDSGDVQLATGAPSTTLVVVERRRATRDCPPFAPPPRNPDGR
jgi:hypothetical protein